MTALKGQMIQLFAWAREMRDGWCLFIVIWSLGMCAFAQSSIPPKPSIDDARDHYGTDCAYFNFYGAPLITRGTNLNSISGIAGVTLGQYFAAPLGKGLGATPQFELGLIGKLPGGHPIDGVGSLNYAFINKVPHHAIYPSVSLGYTRLFVTGNAVNFGAALDLAKNRNGNKLLRLEVKDYYLFTGPQQHILSFRLGPGWLIAD